MARKIDISEVSGAVKETKNVKTREMYVMSFIRRTNDHKLQFALLGGGVRVEDLMSPNFYEDSREIMSPRDMKDMFSSPLVRDKEVNGIYMYSEQFDMYIAPRDSATEETSVFIKDVSMLLSTGILPTDFGNMPRDAYLAEKLNDTEREMLLFYCTDETTVMHSGKKIIRPIGALSAPKAPAADSRKKHPSESAREAANRKHSRMMKRYREEMRAAEKEITERIKAEFGVEGAEKLRAEGKIQTLQVKPSELIVLSYSKLEEEFFRLDPRDLDILKTGVRGKIQTVKLPAEFARRYGITLRLIEEEGFLLFVRGGDNGKPAIIVPEQSGFTTDFCRKIGINTVCRKLCPARDIYLAANLSRNIPLRMVVVNKGEARTCKFYEGIKIYSDKDERKVIDSMDIAANIQDYIVGNGFRQRSVREDNMTFTIDYEMVDSHGELVTIDAGGHEIIPGIEFSFSENVRSGYRLAGVFYTGESIFYCGTYKYLQTRKANSPYQHGAVYSKRKKLGEDVSGRLVRGFFTGQEAVISQPQPSIYSYMLEQAGIYDRFIRDKKFKSPVFMNSAAGGENISVFDALSEGEKLPLRQTIEKIISQELFPEMEIPKKLGKKKLKALMEGIDKNLYGSRLDLLLLLASLSREDAPINYRISAMQVPGDIIGYYGYKAT